MKLKFWNPTVRRIAFNRPKPSARKQVHSLRDGPLDGHKVWMCTAGTLAFRLNGQAGYYSNDNRWCEL